MRGRLTWSGVAWSGVEWCSLVWLGLLSPLELAECISRVLRDLPYYPEARMLLDEEPGAFLGLAACLLVLLPQAAPLP